MLWAFKVDRAGSFSRDCFRRRRTAQDHVNPQLQLLALLLLYHTVPPAFKLSTFRQPRYSNSRASSSSFCDGHGRCFCVCVWNEHMNLKSGAINFWCRTMYHHFLRTSKGNAQPRCTRRRQQRYNNSTAVAAQQQWHNSTLVSRSGLCGSHGAFVFVCVQC